jgi:hypothetical protein
MHGPHEPWWLRPALFTAPFAILILANLARLVDDWIQARRRRRRK